MNPYHRWDSFLPPTYRFVSFSQTSIDLSSQEWQDTFLDANLACSYSSIWLVLATFLSLLHQTFCFLFQMIQDSFLLCFQRSIFMPSPRLLFLLERLSCDCQSCFLILQSFKIMPMYLLTLSL